MTAAEAAAAVVIRQPADRGMLRASRPAAHPGVRWTCAAPVLAAPTTSARWRKSRVRGTRFSRRTKVRPTIIRLISLLTDGEGKHHTSSSTGESVTGEELDIPESGETDGDKA